jgi:hypothetical protein
VWKGLLGPVLACLIIYILIAVSHLSVAWSAREPESISWPLPAPHPPGQCVTIYLLHRPDPASIMAHIVSCLSDMDQDDISLGLNNYIAKAVSPQDPNESVCNHFNLPS